VEEEIVKLEQENPSVISEARNMADNKKRKPEENNVSSNSMP
jgi:hypothetical protein